MLSPFQKEKLTHYFRILDYDNNGVIEKDDFTAIAENLCVLWGIQEGTPDYDKYMELFGASWTDFRKAVRKEDTQVATLDEWLEFADEYLVNGSEAFFDRYVKQTTREIFDCFDVNHDRYIALDEYIDLFMAYHIPVRYSARSYTKLDLNKDDLLSLEELLSAVDEFFRSDDQDAPGNWLFGFWDGVKSQG
jgi:Ca2+-binding EF-hand superfamily protein